jgi:putative restriction endonuclease
VEDPEQGGEVYARVRVRGIAQRVFRSALLRTYDGQCAMCGLTFTEALEAAHIIHWNDASPGQRMDPRNGVLLCATHHRLYDAGLITVADEFRVRYCDPTKADLSPYSKIDEHMSVALHDRPIRLPADKRHWPNMAWLKQRNADDGWDS